MYLQKKNQDSDICAAMSYGSVSEISGNCARGSQFTSRDAWNLIYKLIRAQPQLNYIYNDILKI